MTLVEVMVAMLILTVGVLGTVGLMDTASVASSDTKAREGANNLAREVIENARVIDYDSLTAAGVVPALQAQNGLDDSTPATPTSWTVLRRGITYTLTVSACTYDDAKDGIATTHDASFCATTPGPTGTADVNPDDFRRVDVTVTWPHRTGSGTLTQTALIINPAGGLGPRVTSFLPTGFATPLRTVGPGVTSVGFTVASSFAAGVHWAADDAISSGDATGGSTAWTFSWALGQAGDLVLPFVLDGTYQVTAQAFDPVGIPGDLRTVTVVVNRSAPFAPLGLAGGRDDRVAGQGAIVDLQWDPNPERDVIGYRAYSVGPDGLAGTADDARVCPTAANAEVSSGDCYDSSPPATATSYYVKAVDLDTNGAKREGARSALLAVPASTTGRPYFNAGAQVHATIVDGLPTLTWDGAHDDDGTIRAYRIYRDSAAGYTDRYDRTETSATTYTDGDPGATTSHSYWVTAVDDSFNESLPLGPVTLP